MSSNQHGGTRRLHTLPEIDRHRSAGYIVRKVLLPRHRRKRGQTDIAEFGAAAAAPDPRDNAEGPEWTPPPGHTGKYNLLPQPLRAVLNISDNGKACEEFRVVLMNTLAFAFDLAVHGVDGDHHGALIALGNTDNMMKCSSELLTNPFAGHTDVDLSIFDSQFLRSLKYYTQFDGFVGIRSDGVAAFCGRSIDISGADAVRPARLNGRGTRHKYAWLLSRELSDCVVITLSQNRDITVWEKGQRIGGWKLQKGVKSHYIITPLENYKEPELALYEPEELDPAEHIEVQ